MQLDEYGAPVWIEKGVRCGSHGAQRVYHESAAAVRLCYAVMRAEEAEEKALQEAEMRNERSFEERGYWEAQAQDDWEARNGVIPFDQAMAEAYEQLTPEEIMDIGKASEEGLSAGAVYNPRWRDAMEA